MNGLTRVRSGGEHEARKRAQTDETGHGKSGLGQSMLLRIPEVAAELRLGRSSIYQLIQNGELPVVRVGRAVRVARADLEAWVEDRRREPRQ